MEKRQGAIPERLLPLLHNHHHGHHRHYRSHLKTLLTYLHDQLSHSPPLKALSALLSYWTLNCVLALMTFWLLAESTNPEWAIDHPSALKQQQQVRMAIKGVLLYCLGTVVLIGTHQRYGNDIMRVVRAHHHQGFKNCTLLCLRLMCFYWCALQMPASHAANRLLALMLGYMLLSQQMVQSEISNILSSLYHRHSHFTANYGASQGTCLAPLVAALLQALLPDYVLLRTVTLFVPIVVRFTFCVIYNNRQSLMNGLKYIAGILTLALNVVEMPGAAFYAKVVGNFYSLYWDICHDWKLIWRVRTRRYRMDLPLWVIAVGFSYNLFARTVWLMMPLSKETKIYLEITRRLCWGVLRIERQLVINHPKGIKNRVPDLFSA